MIKCRQPFVVPVGIAEQVGVGGQALVAVADFYLVGHAHRTVQLHHVFAERAPVPVRYGCSWESTRLDDGSIVLVTSDGEYRCRAAVLAIGMTEPWVPAIPGLELEQHYVNVDSAPDRYQDRRVVIVGKRTTAVPIDRYAESDNFVTLESAAFGITIEGRWRTADGAIRGTFVQGPFEVPLVLRRGAGS